MFGWCLDHQFFHGRGWKRTETCIWHNRLLDLTSIRAK